CGGAVALADTRSLGAPPWPSVPKLATCAVFRTLGAPPWPSVPKLAIYAVFRTLGAPPWPSVPKLAIYAVFRTLGARPLAECALMTQAVDRGAWRGRRPTPPAPARRPEA